MLHFINTWDIACSAGVFWVGETLFVFALLKPPSLILWQWKIGESRNSNPRGRCEGERRKGRTRPFSSSLRFQYGAFASKNICAPEENARTAGYLRYQVFTTGSNFNYLSKGWFPLSRNFYVRTCVKVTFANKIEAMYEGSHVSVKVETRSTWRLAQHLISCLYFYLFTWFKFTFVKYVCNTDVFIRPPLY